MKVYDCFLFNNEIELLELRLMETESVVDKWVIVESPISFTHKPKPLFFADNKHLFSDYLDRIHHVIINELPTGPYKTEEYFQRRQLQPAWTAAGAINGDMVIISDVDEIPPADTIRNLLHNPPADMVAFKQYLFYYSIDWRQNQMWNGPVLFQLKNRDYDVQVIRDQRYDIPTVEPGGWHFSWLGPVESIHHKLYCYDIEQESKGEFKQPDANDVAFIDECIKTGKDLLGRSDKYAQKNFVEIDPGGLHPLRIEDWLKKYPQFAQRQPVI